MTESFATFILELPNAEMTLLTAVARRQKLTKNTALRQALRMYNVITLRLATGEELSFAKGRRNTRTKINGGRFGR